MSELPPDPPQNPELTKMENARLAPERGSTTLPPVVVYALLAAVTIFTFWPVVHFDFVNFDDPDYVANPHVLKGLTLGGIYWALGTWHPITWISHMLDAQFFGKDPAGPHFVNLLLHAANAALLFAVLKRFMFALWPSAFVAALFALHPIQVESVAWVAERKGVLSTFFFMLTLLAYARYVKESKVQGPKFKVGEMGPQKTYYVLALVFFALGLLSKPMLVTVPFLLLLLDFWPLKRLKADVQSRKSNAEEDQSLASIPPVTSGDREGFLELVKEKIPFFVLAIGSCILTLVAQGSAGAFQSLEHYSASSRFENAIMSYVHYLGKIFWPVALATPYPRTFHWPPIQFGLGAMLLAIVCAAVIWQRRKLPFVVTGWFWFFVALIPVNGVIQAVAQSVADRYMYLPSIGLFVLVTRIVCLAVARGWVPKTACGVVGAILLLVCAARTRDQLGAWRNGETLFKHALAVTKNNVIAQYNLGMYYQEHDRPDEALASYRRTLEMKRDHADALNNIGFMLSGQRRFGEAIQYFEAALKADPNSAEARNNIGYALCMAGKIDEGIAQYRLALKSKPEHVGVLNNLADALARRRQFAEAIPYYETSLRVNPEQAVAQYGLAHALDGVGQTERAIEHYRLAAEQNSKYAEPRYDLGLAYARKGQLNEAIAQFREAIQLKPDNAAFHFGLGKALAMSQRFDEAIVVYKGGLRIVPTNAEAQSAVGSALATEGKLDAAIPYFKESIRLRPDNPFTHYFLGKALATQGKFKEAEPQFAEALRLKPDFGEAKQELEAIRARTNGSVPKK